jgi:hypothetical protein
MDVDDTWKLLVGALHHLSQQPESEETRAIAVTCLRDLLQWIVEGGAAPDPFADDVDDIFGDDDLFDDDEGDTSF